MSFIRPHVYVPGGTHWPGCPQGLRDAWPFNVDNASAAEAVSSSDPGRSATARGRAMRERSRESATMVPSPRSRANRRKLRTGIGAFQTQATDQTSPRKLIAVEFRSGEAVHRHPALKPFLHDGWEIERAVPQLSDVNGVELLVVMSKSVAVA